VRGNTDAQRILEGITGLPSKELSKQWHEALQAQYRPLIEAKRTPLTYGPAVITEKNAGELNVAPALSRTATPWPFSRRRTSSRSTSTWPTRARGRSAASS